MLQLENHTPFQAGIALLPDRMGIDTLYVMVKATLTLQPSLSLAPEQVPLAMADEYHGDPAASSLRLASEMHIGKPGTDVLVVGHARPPGERPVTRMTVTLAVAERRRDLLVTGDRHWEANGAPSQPLPFESMPLVWERAFGGQHVLADRVLAEERNPVGCGFAGERTPEEMRDLPVPNLEDAASPIAQLGQPSTPVCLAPVAPAWLPRRGFAGTYDETWQRTRAPYLPDDFDARFLQCAGADFAFDRYLSGGEPVELAGMTAESPITFVVPASPLSVEVIIAGSPQQPMANLETLLLEPDANRLCMTWRASVPCDRQALQVENIRVTSVRKPRA